MSDVMKFADREEFRKWLSDHCLSNVKFFQTRLWAGQTEMVCSAFHFVMECRSYDGFFYGFLQFSGHGVNGTD